MSRPLRRMSEQFWGPTWDEKKFSRAKKRSKVGLNDASQKPLETCRLQQQQIDRQVSSRLSATTRRMAAAAQHPRCTHRLAFLQPPGYFATERQADGRTLPMAAPTNDGVRYTYLLHQTRLQTSGSRILDVIVLIFVDDSRTREVGWAGCGEDPPMRCFLSLPRDRANNGAARQRQRMT